MCLKQRQRRRQTCMTGLEKPEGGGEVGQDLALLQERAGAVLQSSPINKRRRLGGAWDKVGLGVDGAVRGPVAKGPGAHSLQLYRCEQHLHAILT